MFNTEMKRLFTTAILLACLSGLYAQIDSTFVGKFENEEYKIFLEINLVEKNILVPEQEVFGEMDGYVGSTQTTHVWTIVSSEVKGNTAMMELVNNYGSEDFKATLTYEKDGTYTWKHQGGSTLKFPVNRKWQKIPGKVVFIRKLPLFH